jgi:hypothetical protein
LKSAKLAILAAAAVDGRVNDRLVAFGLAGDAGADAGQRLAPFFGIGSPQSSHSSALSPDGVRARARRTASFTVSSICCSTAPSRVHPPAMM